MGEQILVGRGARNIAWGVRHSMEEHPSALALLGGHAANWFHAKAPSGPSDVLSCSFLRVRKTDLDLEPTRMGLTREATSEFAHDHRIEEARAEP